MSDTYKNKINIQLSNISDVDRRRFMKNPFLAEKELAQRWGVSAKTVQKARYSRTGPTPKKILGCVRYYLPDILEYEARADFPYFNGDCE